MSMILRQIFAKPVDRPIDGVIKADDEASLRIELEEYVITAEIEQRLEQFLEAYNNYDNANGVWISGFFGSGKSHLLKMLALVLENRVVDGRPAFELFRDKDKLAGRPMLEGALRKAIAVPSKSVLFNIDQKADVISKTEVDALLAVFQKVFDEMCGYYGKQAHIAQFERDLDSRGEFLAFKETYTRVSGKPWERGREQALLEKTSIAKAFAEVTGTSVTDAGDILGHYRKDHRVSIEDFANTIKAWLDHQPRGFRLNFFVDEVGQYIADNTKLMTNLQTIAESLNTKCKGQAWIIVTAQQDMNAVIGDMSARQENDFSKIQARFRTRMPLNSADVAEVIQKRLLSKTQDGEIRLRNLFDREENNLRTLFGFADGSMPLKNYSGRDNFISSHPFPPYQYTLFQAAISKLSEHNAFEGRHSSVGERSMLGVFQEVATQMKELPYEGIATFDMMYEGIRAALKSTVQQSIHYAEKNIDNAFAVKILKALFLVKYVKGFKPTVRNIGILMLKDFETDQTALRRKIEEALNDLERATLIQRNGDVYEFLTSDEKDVESEIKAVDVDLSELIKEFEDLAFDTILRHRKIKYVTTGHEYPFSRKIDDTLRGREYELSLNLITPLHESAANPDAVRMQTLAKDELAIVLPQDDRFMKDLRLYRQTLKFVRHARDAAQTGPRERIVTEKGEQNARRFKDLEVRLRKLLEDARIFVRGDELEINSEDPQERIVRAFQTLIEKVYVNLPMLRGVSYAEADVLKAVRPDSSLFGAGGTGLTESEQEVLNHTQSQARLGVKVSVKALLEKFGSKPFGWPSFAVLCVVASLSTKGKLEARADSAVLEGVPLAKALSNSNAVGNILLTPQIEFSAPQIRKAKDLFKDFFDAPAESTDARALGAEWLEALRRLDKDLGGFQALKTSYPFLAALDPLATKITGMLNKQPAWFITDLAAQEDALMDAKEDILDPIRRFMGTAQSPGAQKVIYDDVRLFLGSHEANIGDVDPAQGAVLKATLADPSCFKGTSVQDLKNTLYELKNAVELKVVEERKLALDELEGCRTKLQHVEAFTDLNDAAKAKIENRISAYRSEIEDAKVIAVLRNKAALVATRLLPDLLVAIDAMSHPEPQPRNPEPVPTSGGGMNERPQPDFKPSPKPAPPTETYVNASQVKVNVGKPLLTDEADVETYVTALKKTLLAEIRKGKKVIV
ncbi:hypothetical protein ATY76_14295 [Rhizobium sp. R339]|uniref:BREX system P-loop protein BrxC n=1 Tax=Rhizobium sp. R339 TaxID=1764273 RepID=UPI000B529EB7|nr:BREX system P-loop protein BrxC [Rhizobium sp. R339]OWV68073.1 hypothetical protein ATY76_14295 [Rhizobium sp. R339]